MRLLTLRGWLVAITVGVLSATVTLFVWLQIRHWLTDEQQLHEIVALIQSGRITVQPPPAPAPPPSK